MWSALCRGARHARGAGRRGREELAVDHRHAGAGESAGGEHLRRQDRSRDLSRRPAARPRGTVQRRLPRPVRPASNMPTTASCGSGRRCWSATANDEPALPHIRLDRALQFLIGDRLRMTREERRIAAGHVPARRSGRRDGPDETGRLRRHRPSHRRRCLLPAAGADRRRASGAQRFRWGALFWSAARRSGLLALASGRQPDRGPVRAQRRPGLGRAGASRSLRGWRCASSSGASFGCCACEHRKAAQRATDGPASDDRDESRAVVTDLMSLAHREPATGARPRHAGQRCRRHHRRRRPDHARRARIDGAAR